MIKNHMKVSLESPQALFGNVIRYEIPAFQRRYVWTQEEQWEPLWDDVEKLAQSILDDDPDEAHFMGAIVLQGMQHATTTMQPRIVVDGQQRLTTLQVLIDAIRKVLKDRGKNKAAKRLTALVVNKKEYRAGKPDNAFKVWPTIVDRDAFRHVMSDDPAESDYAASRIVQAHKYFKHQSKQWLDRFPDKTKKAILALEETVRWKLAIVIIDLGYSDDPHVIFETLNARGTPLLQSDMVKNKILYDAGIGQKDNDSEVSEADRYIWPFDQDDWWAEEIGRGLQRRPRVDVYLNHWLTLRNRAEMKPYDEFRAFEEYTRERTEKSSKIQEVAKDMGNLGRIYREVEEFQREDIAKFVKRRIVMGVGVVTPLLLWLLDANLSPAKLTNCLKALESFLVRRVVCRYSARGYGKLFVGLLEKLHEGPANNTDRIIVSYLGKQTAQAALWPGDKELHECFMTEPLYQYLTQGRLRMVLEGIEEALRTNKAESGDVPEKLHIEHVMPQAWNFNWPLPDDIFDDQDAIENRKKAIHTIGNLTLVNQRLNSSLSNAPWDSKRKTLADHSVLFLNKQLVNEGPDVWDETAIKKRAKRLYKLAAKTWPHSNDFEAD